MQVSSYLKVSAVVAVANIALKAGAWYVSGSVSLLSDAIEGLVNLAGAVFALLMVSWAAQPPDEGHPYGHHKAEYFSSGFEGVLIVAAAIAIVGAAGERLFHPAPVQSVGLGVGLSLLSTLLNGGLAVAMLGKAAKERSIALVAWTGWLWLDPVVAIGVALNILREGWDLVWRSSQGLMDKRVERTVQAEIDRVLKGFAHPTIRFDHIATRRSGSRRYVDLHMHMPGEWTLRRAAAVRGSVEQALMSAVPGLRASIQLLPSDVEAHAQDQEDLI